MAIIDPNGLFYGDRLARCSDEAQLHWVRFFTASNTFARLELNYRQIISTAYGSFKSKPTEEQVAGWVREFHENFLLFIYTAPNGSLWGQWLTSKENLRKYQTSTDKRSPGPDEKELEVYRQQYISKKQAKSIAFNELSKPLQFTLLGIGEGIGKGIGDGKEQEQKTPAKPTAPQVEKVKETKTAIAKSRHDAFKDAIRKYWATRNPEVEMPWGPVEGRNLEMWLKESPTTTLDQFLTWLKHRFKSEVNHTERPSTWIRTITKFAKSPIDKFGQPLLPVNVNGGRKNATVPLGKAEGNMAVLNESLARAEHQSPAYENGDLPASENGQTDTGPIHGILDPFRPKGISSGNGELVGEQTDRRRNNPPVTW